MSDQRPNGGFQFVNATLTNPQAPQDKAVRALIRKHAMKKASDIRRQLGNYGKHNLRQYPVFYGSTTQNSVEDRTYDEGSRERDEFDEFVDESLVDENFNDRPRNSLRLVGSKLPPLPDTVICKSRLPPGLSQQGYEAVVAAYNFDVVDLSAVALLRLGRSACMMLSTDLSKLTGLLRCKWPSYLTYLPSRYGYSPCLSDAVDCILARVRQIFSPTDTKLNSTVISRYIKALKSLQKALYNATQCYEPEVLCAVEILALYELLNPSSTAAWIRHTAGAARLIQIRGPESYKTDFEKALFMTHASPIINETILNNEKCFLEEEPWKRLFESLVLENHGLSHHSDIAITILILKSRVPTICKDATSVICSNNEMDIIKLKSALFGARELLADLDSWLCKYRDIISRPYDSSVGSHNYEMQSDITSTYLTCRMIITRLIAALSSEERASMEQEAQKLAVQTFELEKAAMAVSPYASLLLAQAVAVANSIRSTAHEWKIDSPTETTRDMEIISIIERGIFEHWCTILGRKVS